MKQPTKEVELHSDAWARFERAIDTAMKSPPQHRKSSGARAKKAKKKAKKKPG